MRSFSFLISSLSVISGWSQTFTSTPGTAINSLLTITDDIVVSGIGTIDCDYGLEQICIDITHTFDADLDIFLIDPAGDAYLLTSDNGGGGNNYSTTCFDMSAVTAVTAGSAPFNGSFIPEGDIGLANNGQDANGTWTLEVTDDAFGDIGTLVEWSLVFAATPACPPPPPVEDCAGGITVCTDETFTGNSSGSGSSLDLDASNDGCLFGENESSWYYFQAETDGTYAFMIETGVDYDFAVWGPLGGVVCPPNAPPSRCSYSGTIGNTGLQAGAGDNTEDEFGDAVVDPISALAGELYIIVIDNFSADGTSFDLVWTLTDGAVLDCTLPIELSTFTGFSENRRDVLTWTTKSELNNDFFLIEYSTDGMNWDVLGQVSGAGNSSEEQHYEYTHFPDDHTTVVYYRLSQYDFDGTEDKLGVISIQRDAAPKLLQIVNLMGEVVDESYTGLKIYQYDDGTTGKQIRQ